jgi:hypothetical protein
VIPQLKWTKDKRAFFVYQLFDGGAWPRDLDEKSCRLMIYASRRAGEALPGWAISSRHFYAHGLVAHALRGEASFFK